MKAKKVIEKVLGIGVAALGIGLLIWNLSDKEEYNDNWLHSASDDELEKEREKVRLAHCSGDETAWANLNRFDSEMSKRANKGHENKNYGYPVHREHGWYLSNDD